MTSPSPAASAVDRSIPKQLLDIATQAIRRGSARVALVHESPGYDFPAPIGWVLWVRGPELHLPAVDQHPPHLICAQIGDDPSEYELPHWLAERDEQPVIENLVTLFETAVRNGWDAVYERDIIGHHAMLRAAERLGLAPVGMRHSLEVTATRWGYTGDEPSTAGGSLSQREGTPEDTVAFWSKTGDSIEVTPADAEGLMKAAAPWSVPVAYFDTETDEWVK